MNLLIPQASLGHVTAAVLEDPRAAGGHLSSVHVVHGALVEGTGHHHVVHLLQVHLVEFTMEYGGFHKWGYPAMVDFYGNSMKSLFSMYYD